MTTSESIGMWAAIATGAGVLVNLVGVFVFYRQLARMAEANRLSNAMAVVSLEEMLRAARKDLATVSLSIVANENTPGHDFAHDKLVMEERIEQYLNVADRLCSYIRRGYIDEATYRQDYRQFIAEIVKQYTNYFGADTRHPNILYVHRAWSEDRSARL